MRRFSLVFLNTLVLGISPTLYQDHTSGLLETERLTDSQKMELAKNRLTYVTSVPWMAKLFYESYELQADVQEAIEGRRRERWDWYGLEWGSHHTKLSRRSMPVHRFRVESGNMTRPPDSDDFSEDNRFFQHGFNRIAKPSYFDNNEQSLIHMYYEAGSRGLEGYSYVFHELANLMRRVQHSTLLDDADDKSSLQKKTLSGDRIVASWLLRAVLKEEAEQYKTNQPEKRRRTDRFELPPEPSPEMKSYPDVFGPSSSLEPRRWIYENVLLPGDLSVLRPLTSLIRGIIKSMRYWETQNSPKSLHPNYLENVDLQNRLSSLARLRDACVAMSRISMDYSISSRKEYYNDLRLLLEQVDRLYELYESIGARFGFEHFKSASYYYSRNKIMLASAAARSAALKHIGIRHNVAEKMLAISGRRLDVAESTARLTLTAMPSLEIEVMITRPGVYEVRPMRWNFHKAFRQGVEAELKFRYGYEAITLKALQESVLRELVTSSDDPTQVAFSQPNTKKYLTVYFKSEILCYYDAQYGRSRMVELVQIAVPGIRPKLRSSTSSYSIMPEKKEFRLIPKLNDATTPNKFWMAIGMTYDSWNDQKSAGINLLGAYIRDQAERSGVLTRSSNQFEHLNVTQDSCDINDLLDFTTRRMSSEGPHRSRVAPAFKVKSKEESVTGAVAEHANFNRWKRLELYRTCLNIAPSESLIFLTGNPTPGVVKPSLASHSISALRKVASRAAEFKRPNFIANQYTFTQLDSYDLKFRPELASKIKRDFQEQEREHTAMLRQRNQFQDAEFDRMTAEAKKILDANDPTEDRRQIVVPEYSILPMDIGTEPKASAPEAKSRTTTTSGPVLYLMAKCQGGGQGWSVLERIDGKAFNDMTVRSQLKSREKAETENAETENDEEVTHLKDTSIRVFSV